MRFRSLHSGVRGVGEKGDVAQLVPKRRAGEPLAEPSAKPLWPCLLSSIAVAVTPLRNLTGDPDRQFLSEAFTESLVSHLRRHGRGFSLQRLAEEPGMIQGNIAGNTEVGAGYVVDGSAQRGDAGMLRVNVRITDAATNEYLWARRYEYSAEELEENQARIIRHISRELHLLFLENEIR